MKRIAAVFCGLVVASALGLAVWAFGIEPGLLVSRVHRIALPAWPTTCQGLRIAVIADLHTGSPHNGLDRIARLIARTAAEQPDLVLLAGAT